MSAHIGLPGLAFTKRPPPLGLQAEDRQEERDTQPELGPLSRENEEPCVKRDDQC
jgi:hypothetical protein